MKMQIPVEAGNRAASAIEATLKKLMADLKPEAATFTRPTEPARRYGSST